MVDLSHKQLPNISRFEKIQLSVIRDRSQNHKYKQSNRKQDTFQHLLPYLINTYFRFTPANSQTQYTNSSYLTNTSIILKLLPFNQLQIQLNIIVMNQFQRSSINEDAKHLIRNLPIPTFEQSLSSFTSSRNQFSKVQHINYQNSPEPHELSIFPTNNDPSIDFIEGNSIIDMAKKSPQYYQKIIDDLKQQNRLLSEQIRILKLKLENTQNIPTSQNNINNDKKGSLEIRRLQSLITEKDKKNIELFNLNKQLTESLKISKQDLEVKAKQLASKSQELKKQKEKVESLSKSRETQRSNRSDDSRREQLLQQLAKRQSDIRTLKEHNKILSSKLVVLQQQVKDSKAYFLEQMQKQTNLYTSQIHAMKSQQISRSSSLRSQAMYTHNNSLSESFSPEMLSPQETIQLIFNVLRKISKSQMMQKILYSNSTFVSLLHQLAGKKF